LAERSSRPLGSSAAPLAPGASVYAHYVRGVVVKISPFGVEQWMNAHELRCEFNLAETCVESLTVDQLLTMTGKRHSILDELLPQKLTYGAIEGSERLRATVCALFASHHAANVLITHGGIGANALVYQALVEPGDDVVAIVPNYQQHYSIPESLGAKVRLLKLQESAGFLPDPSELKQLVNGSTKLISLSNPNNPTGALLERAQLEEIVRIADSVGAYVLCDEVYRGTAQKGDTLTPSIADLYAKGISTGSMSKAFSLAGLRLGWIVGPKEVLRAAEIHRDYNTISVGMLDDYFAAIALENYEKILTRNRHIVRTNLAILDEWVGATREISYVKPKGGTVALLKYIHPILSRDFCLRLLDETGVLFTPGSALDMEGYVRIGYANHETVLREGLSKVSSFLRTLAA
jgi:aspartate/methionine/tyrosine aminotransferase